MATTDHTGMDPKLLRPDILRAEKISTLSWIVIVTGILYQFFYVFQGLDFTDTGFHMTAYQQIFDHPETVHYSFMFYLSNVTGGLFMKLFPGLLANRIASVILHTGMFWLYYDLLRHITDKNKAIIYTFLSLLFFQYYGFETLNYDSFTAVSMGLSVYLLVKGLWSNQVRLLLLGAFVSGVATYFRITNLAYILFIPLTVIIYYLDKKDLSNTFKIGGLMGLSYLLGHISIIAIMISLGHWELFLSNIAFVKEMGAAGDSSHGFLSVMVLYIKGWLKIGLFVSLIIAFFFLKQLVKSFISFDLMKGLLLFGFGFAIFFIYQFPTGTWSKLRYLVYAGILLNTVHLIWKGDKKIATLCLFAFMFMVLFPLGSDSGIEKLYFSCGLSLSLLFYHIDSTLSESKWIPIKNIALTLYATTCLCFGFTNTYFDLGSRLYKTNTIDHPYLSGIYTTKARANEVGQLLNELEKHTKKGDYLLAFSDIPMANYLTETLPYIGTSWPKLYYAPYIFETKLNKAYEIIGPVTILLQKMEMRSAWPKNDSPNYLDLSLTKDGGHPENRLPKHYQIMFDFLDHKGYKSIWENESFRIYKIMR